MRVHRSFIVNLNKIRTVERNCIIFGKTYIPISDTYRDKFNEFLNGKFL
jgi:DNA-binding LytR/AlgR family response regulator